MGEFTVSKDPDVWLLTEKGLMNPRGERIRDEPFGRRSLTAGAAGPNAVGIVAEDHEVWIRSRGTWSKGAFSDVDLYCIAHLPDRGFLVGTERARMAWVEHQSLSFIDSFDVVPERPLWDTPYGAPPELRSLAVATDGTIYANVHVGWIVRSTDGGRTWRTVRKGLDRDVHQVAVHPSDPKTVFAATAVGFHISHDRGDSFVRRTKGLPYYYQRATACFPDRDVYLVSTAQHDRGAGAQLHRSEDEGALWRRVRGLPENVDRNINTHQVAVLPDGRGYVVVGDTSVFETEDWGESWRLVARDLPAVNALLAV